MKKCFELVYEGEIRFGPAYFRLKINNQEVRDAIFGDHYAELGDNYLAIEEWLTTDYEKGPITRVTIFDVQNNLMAHLKVVEKGFVRSFKLEDGVFSYAKEFKAQGKAVVSEVDWGNIKNWVPCHS